MTELILVRHGKSTWNELNLFTGWVDVPLSKRGMDEAYRAGEKIKNKDIQVIFTSELIRAKQTALLMMLEHSSKKVPVIQQALPSDEKNWNKIYNDEAINSTIPVYCSSAINERMYGKLQGLNKAETIEKYGKDQVQLWRRSYSVAPPDGESLEMTAKRSIPYFKNNILPFLQDSKNVLVVAHGNSLRSIIMYIENLTEDEIIKRELATGEPIIYKFKDNKFHS